ncbi:hypothetical protein TNCV_1993341 [Trichonephila clavipes]|nr:hypothetical protein TNCV_1993341 [Trichonephila clavipes]
MATPGSSFNSTALGHEDNLERRRFKEGRGSIEDNERVGRPTTSWNEENVSLVSECVRKDRRQILTPIAESTHFSKTSFEGYPFVVSGLTSGSVTTGIFYMTTQQHIDPSWLKTLFAKTHIIGLEHPPVQQTKPRVTFICSHQ